MKNSYIPNGGTLADKAEIELDMLRVLVLYEVSREVHGTNIVTVDKSAPRQWTVQLLR